MAVLLLVPLMFAALFADLAPRRLRLPLAGLSISGIGLLFVIDGWLLNGYAPPGVAGLVILAVGGSLLLINWRFPPPPDVGVDELAAADLVSDARLVTGYFAYRWQKGHVSLTGTRLSFESLDGTPVFDIDIARADGFDFPLLGPVTGRSQLKVRAGVKTYAIAFGHSMQLDLGVARDERDLWRTAIRSRLRAV